MISFFFSRISFGVFIVYHLHNSGIQNFFSQNVIVLNHHLGHRSISFSSQYFSIASCRVRDLVIKNQWGYEHSILPSFCNSFHLSSHRCLSTGYHHQTHSPHHQSNRHALNCHSSQDFISSSIIILHFIKSLWVYPTSWFILSVANSSIRFLRYQLLSVFIEVFYKTAVLAVVRHDIFVFHSYRLKVQIKAVYIIFKKKKVINT